MIRSAANFRILEVRKLPTPLTSGDFSFARFGEIKAAGYKPGVLNEIRFVRNLFEDTRPAA